MSEFRLIDRYFTAATTPRADVVVGIGDDAAILQPPAGQQMVVATDTLVAGVHFPLDTTAEAIGYKALAVNLSDLAAMGATPAWALLALTLPEQAPQWLTGFMAGFSSLAEQFNVALVGGDTTRGPLTITVQIIGHVPAGAALTRGGARSGDRIFVTGKLGDAALALHALSDGGCGQEDLKADFRERLDFPTPRIAAGTLLRSKASSAIDVSDGLIADLGHILTASGVGARVVRDRIPRSERFLACLSAGGVDAQTGWQIALAGGDDYELCFTIPEKDGDEMLGRDWSVCNGITEIGVITAEKGLQLVDLAGQPVPFVNTGGYDHFS
ncbi:MAG: thiamine-phosphate kinase [Gammaproteobacteria bacterium]|nr:MAG: thiamine-phosphate kinase [Gammaproteobacteria bacterium]RLA14924.1 MAG: thiamine-phosphate kinase [Gammaproteobacteria bacterium]